MVGLSELSGVLDSQEQTLRSVSELWAVKPKQRAESC